MKKVALLLIMAVMSLKLFAPFLFIVPLKNVCVDTRLPFESFLNDIKNTETWHDSLSYKYGNPWKAVNNIGALGGFQFMPSTLRWLGYTGSFRYFLNNPEVQIKYMIKLIEINKKIASSKSYKYKVTISDSIGKTINGVQITWSSIIGAAHLAGVGGVQRWIARKGNSKDCNGTTVEKYFKKFNNYNMNIHPKTKEAYDLVHNGILTLAKMEENGVRIDLPYVIQKKVSMERKMLRLENEFKETKFYRDWCKSVNGEPNIYSSSQLQKFLYTYKGITPPKFTAKGLQEMKEYGESDKGSTDIESIKSLGIPELAFYENKNRCKKAIDVLSGFDREQVDSIIHPFFNLHIARTFRSSMNGPNLQNVPIRDEELMKLVRTAIIPRKGHQLLEIDFSNLEVRIAACYNQDPNLIKYILDPTTDMHRDMAIQLFMLDEFDKNNTGHSTLRKAAKNGFVFPEFYGDYYKDCAEILACKWGQLPKGKWKHGQGIIVNSIDDKVFNDLTLADHLISKGFKELGEVKKDAKGYNVVTGFMKHVKDVEKDFWENRFSHYQQWKERHYSTYQRYGYFDLKTGFRCAGIMDKKNVINYPIQGSAFQCLLWSLIKTDEYLTRNNLDTKLILQIHDSMLLDVNPKELTKVSRALHRITCIDLPAAWTWINIPMKSDMELAEIDRPWSEKEKFELV